MVKTMREAFPAGVQHKDTEYIVVKGRCGVLFCAAKLDCHGFL